MTPPRVVTRGMGVSGRFRGASGTPPPCGLPGNGRQREPAPHPALRGHLPPRGKARAVVGGSANLREASGTPPPTGCPGMGGSGRPRRGGGTPPYGWGYGNTVGLTRAAVPGPPFPGRRTVGAGHARPAGLRRQASMVRSVGRGLDPSAGGYPGDGCWRKPPRGVEDAAPYGLPGDGRRRKVAAGWGHPALRMGIWKRCGVYVSSRFRADAR